MNLASFLWDCVGGEVNPEIAFDAATCWQHAANVDWWFPRHKCAEGMGSGHSDTKINQIFSQEWGGDINKTSALCNCRQHYSRFKAAAVGFPSLLS